jgi:hypothetical protein
VISYFGRLFFYDEVSQRTPSTYHCRHLDKGSWTNLYRISVILKPLAVRAATVHYPWIARFHPVRNPAFLPYAQLIDDALGFCFIEAMMKIPTML